jgi:hypothetical protein
LQALGSHLRAIWHAALVAHQLVVVAAASLVL